jgi:hypothetical protein
MKEATIRHVKDVFNIYTSIDFICMTENKCSKTSTWNFCSQTWLGGKLKHIWSISCD